MVLLKLNTRLIIISYVTYLHSTMVLLKLSVMLMHGLKSPIYIPLWFFSNENEIIVEDFNPLFTFHYGSSQTESFFDKNFL